MRSLHMMFTLFGGGCCYKFPVNPWKTGSDFQVTAASRDRNTAANTARCWRLFTKFHQVFNRLWPCGSACWLLPAQRKPSAFPYHVYSLLTGARALSGMHTTSGNSAEQAWNSQLRNFGPLWKPQWTNWWHTLGRNNAWLFPSPS